MITNMLRQPTFYKSEYVTQRRKGEDTGQVDIPCWSLITNTNDTYAGHYSTRLQTIAGCDTTLHTRHRSLLYIINTVVLHYYTL